MVWQNTFTILGLTGDNMIEKHYQTRNKLVYGCPFEKIYIIHMDGPESWI